MSHLAHALDILSQLPQAPVTPTPDAGEPQSVGIDTSTILEWTVRAILPLFFVFIGIVLLGRAKSGRMSEVMNTVAIVVIALVFIGGAVVLPFLGGTLVDIFFE
ncbi:MAG TPA: hypothetical protein VK453_25610 [Micromonosporaceae bacterium]|nr:hypothetical protein [Micromonosporaceae bacterium]